MRRLKAVHTPKEILGKHQQNPGLQRSVVGLRLVKSTD